MRVSGAFSYTNNEIVVLRHKKGDTVVKNPIADENRQKIIRLIWRSGVLNSLLMQVRNHRVR